MKTDFRITVIIKGCGILQSTTNKLFRYIFPILMIISISKDKYSILNITNFRLLFDHKFEIRKVFFKFIYER